VQKETISIDRKKRLEDIGIVWSIDEKSWDNGFSALKAFRSREGHCSVPQKYVEGACRLGAWVNWQRFYRDRLSTEQIEKLNNLAFVWNVRDMAYRLPLRFATIRSRLYRDPPHFRVVPRPPHGNEPAVPFQNGGQFERALFISGGAGSELVEGSGADGGLGPLVLQPVEQPPRRQGDRLWRWLLRSPLSKSAKDVRHYRRPLICSLQLPRSHLVVQRQCHWGRSRCS
jgi:hypothetical protein